MFINVPLSCQKPSQWWMYLNVLLLRKSDIGDRLIVQSNLEIGIFECDLPDLL